MEKYFNTKGLSEHLLIPEQTIRRWVLNDEIPYFRIHGVIRYRLSEIENWVDTHRDKVPAFLSKKQENELFNETEEAETTEAAESGVEK